MSASTNTDEGLDAHAMSITVGGVGSYAGPTTPTLPDGNVYTSSLAVGMDSGACGCATSSLATDKVTSSGRSTPTIVGLIPNEVIPYARAYAASSLVGWATAAKGAPANTDVAGSSKHGPATADSGRRVSTLALAYGKDIRPTSADTSAPAAGRERGVGSAVSAHISTRLG